MPKKLSIEEKTRWLNDYENGLSEAKIAKNNKHDLRIVRNGIDEARQARDIRTAGVELLKEALRNHQRNLLDHLKGLRTTLQVPKYDYHPLNWKDCIYPNDSFNLLVKDLAIDKVYIKRKRGDVRTISNEYLLAQHLENDDTKAWTKLAQWEDAYTEYLQHRAYLQLTVIEALKNRFAIPVISERDIVDPPFIYGYTTGDLLFGKAIASKTGMEGSDIDPEKISINPETGSVSYGTVLIGELTDTSYLLYESLKKSLNEIKASNELFNVITSTERLVNVVEGLTPILDSILAANYLQGRCEACRRLGL